MYRHPRDRVKNWYVARPARVGWVCDRCVPYEGTGSARLANGPRGISSAEPAAPDMLTRRWTG